MIVREILYTPREPSSLRAPSPAAVWRERVPNVPCFFRDKRFRRDVFLRWSSHTIPFERKTGILPVRYSARIMPEALKAVIDELLVYEHAGSAAEFEQ